MDEARNPRQLIEERRAAEELSLSRMTLWRYRQAGEIEFVRIGRKVLYRPEALDAFIGRHTRKVS